MQRSQLNRNRKERALRERRGGKYKKGRYGIRLMLRVWERVKTILKQMSNQHRAQSPGRTARSCLKGPGSLLLLFCNCFYQLKSLFSAFTQGHRPVSGGEVEVQPPQSWCGLPKHGHAEGWGKEWSYLGPFHPTPRQQSFPVHYFCLESLIYT